MAKFDNTQEILKSCGYETEGTTLLNPAISYMIGFIQADGSLSQQSRNRGRLQIEIAASDQPLLEELQKLIPVYSKIRTRTRDTNFKINYKSSILSVCKRDFREFLIKNGVPVGRKHLIIKPPNRVHLVDYIRGLIDGDGSIGYTSAGLPFVGLCTCSDEIAKCFASFVKTNFKYEKFFSRNKRDGAYNLMFTREIAVGISKVLYYDGCISLPRKLKMAKTLVWDKGYRYIIKQKRFSEEENRVVVRKDISRKEIAKLLKRTEKSICMQRWRLKKAELNVKVGDDNRR